MEQGTGLALLGGAIGSAKLLEKLLGPTAEYLGGEVRNYTEKGLSNLKHISVTLLGRSAGDLTNPARSPRGS